MPRPANLQKVIPPETKRKALAMMARGDKIVAIAKMLKVSPQTLYNLKQANLDLLAQMQTTVDNYRAEQAKKILDKSQKRIIEQLDHDKSLKLTDLNTVSKTAYDQLRLEEGKPTSIGATAPLKPGEATQENLEALMAAIKSGDEVVLQRMVLRDNK